MAERPKRNQQETGVRRMKKIPLLLMSAALASLALSSCGKNAVDTENIAFTDNDLIQSSYGGLGVEWGVYEDTDKLDASSWLRIYANIAKRPPGSDPLHDQLRLVRGEFR
jgi:hypothetical protein